MMLPLCPGRWGSRALSAGGSSVPDMNPIAFVPHTRELFLIEPEQDHQDELGFPAAAPLLNRLRALGWPTQARVYMPGSEAAWRGTRGLLIELLDALPVLASFEACGHPALDALCAVARLALRLVQRGRLVPRLRAIGTGASGAPRRFEARWNVVTEGETERGELSRLGAALQPLVAIPEDARGEHRPRSWMVTGARLVQRLLDDCADLLVREACRRGAMVRLGGMPASAWEQRLVRALADDRGHFLCDPADGVALMAELNAWTSDTLSPQALPLLPSPATWSAPEQLLGVMRRLLTPAARLADALRSGRPAPRTLFVEVPQGQSSTRTSELASAMAIGLSAALPALATGRATASPASSTGSAGLPGLPGLSDRTRPGASDGSLRQAA